MKRLTCFFFFFSCIISFSQTIDVDKPGSKSAALTNVFSDVGTPFIEAKFVRLVSGSPFFNEKMMKGILISGNNTEYRNLIMRINLLESQVNFLNTKQQEMIVGAAIREVTLWDTINKKNYHFVYSDYIETTAKLEKGFYQVSEKGNATLYTLQKKVLKETRQFNAATYEQSIETYSTYFVLIGKEWKKVNKIKDLPSVLSDKKNEIQEYINSKGLSGYKQEDIESVVNYYNSLFAGKQ